MVLSINKEPNGNTTIWMAQNLRHYRQRISLGLVQCEPVPGFLFTAGLEIHNRVGFCYFVYKNLVCLCLNIAWNVSGRNSVLADKEKTYLWFISFIYRLRNALFHEIIDPLNDEWQVIFKNSYHVLKQVVDQNIWRLKQLKLLPLWKNVLTCLTSISHLLTGGLRSKASR